MRTRSPAAALQSGPVFEGFTTTPQADSGPALRYRMKAPGGASPADTSTVDPPVANGHRSSRDVSEASGRPRPAAPAASPPAGMARTSANEPASSRLNSPVPSARI